MRVRIRFGRGPVVARRRGKNSRIALLGSGALNLNTICLFSLGSWRVCQDMGLAGDFVFASGFLSHWQVWMGAAGLSHYCSYRLSRYAKLAQDPEQADLVSEEAEAEKQASLAANV
jgi:hypothetical protein